MVERQRNPFYCGLARGSTTGSAVAPTGCTSERAAAGRPGPGAVYHWGGHAPGQPLDRRTHGIARAPVAYRIEQRPARTGAADQALGIGQQNRVIPWTLQHERQVESRRALRRFRAATAASRLAVPLRSKSRAGIDAEPASASRTAGPSMRTSSTIAVPCEILIVTVSFSNGVRPLRKSPPPASGTLLKPPQQLLHIEPGQRALAAGQGGGSAQRAGQRHAPSRPRHRPQPPSCPCLRSAGCRSARSGRSPGPRRRIAAGP